LLVELGKKNWRSSADPGAAFNDCVAFLDVEPDATLREMDHRKQLAPGPFTDCFGRHAVPNGQFFG
jgi:hypothetical protein